MEWLHYWILLNSLAMMQWIVRIAGDIHCHCNEAGCVRTGYMCKSLDGRCYSLLKFEGENGQYVHGCIDTLSVEQRTMCSADGELIKAGSNSPDGVPLILCCIKDMCNYRDALEISIVVSPKLNGSLIKGYNQRAASSSSGNSNIKPSKNAGDRSQEKDLWFKAAVIAVPLAGGFILILLVLLAVRMLRTDTRRNKRLPQYRSRKMTKAQHFVADHFSDTRGNKTSCSFYSEKQNIYKDVNVKVDKDGKIYEKMCDKHIQKTNHPSIIIWGSPVPATVV